MAKGVFSGGSDGRLFLLTATVARISPYFRCRTACRGSFVTRMCALRVGPHYE